MKMDTRSEIVVSGKAEDAAIAHGRLFGPDLLRCISCFAVVCLHVAGRRLQFLPLDDPMRPFVFAVSVASSFAVPCFFMLSGMFFLDPLRPVRSERCVRACGRFLMLCAFWSLIYDMCFLPDSPYLFVVKFFKGPGHLWFLWSLACCYLLVPALRRLSEAGKKEEAWFLAVVFAVTLIPTDLRALSPHLNRVLPNAVDFSVCSASLWCFVLGDYLHRFSPQTNRCKVFIVLGVIGFAGAGGLSWWRSLSVGGGAPGLRPENTFVSLFAASVFFFFIAQGRVGRLGDKRPWIRFLSARVSGLTLGIYLVHGLVLKVLPIFGDGIGTLFAEAFIVFSASLAIALVVKHIPFLRSLV